MLATGNSRAVKSKSKQWKPEGHPRDLEEMGKNLGRDLERVTDFQDR